MLKIFKAVFPFEDFLYILQQEEYLSDRYIYWLQRFFFRRSFQKRDYFKRTSRGVVIFVVSVLIWLISTFSVLLFNSLFAQIVLIALSVILIPIWVLFGNVLTYPFFAIERDRRQKKASEIIKSMHNLKIIGIAGSFGKTTVKNFIFQFVKASYKTQMIPGNINTPDGIADWVADKLKKETQLLICEMDTYQIGEIKKSCNIVPADIAVITNFGDQHMVRFSDSKELRSAILELFKYAKPNAIKISAENISDINIKIINPKKYNTTLFFSKSNTENLYLALTVAEQLNIPQRYVLDSLKTLELPDRRQKECQIFGFTAIDDSYNISFITAKAGIKAVKELAKSKKKKVVCITAGIPELSKTEINRNRELGSILSKEVEYTIILKSIFATELSISFVDKARFSVEIDLTSAVKVLVENFNPNEWVLLMQPELTDLYYKL